MKILHVIPYLTLRRGGDVNACINLALGLVARGHSVTIVTTDFEFDPECSKGLEDGGIRVVVSHRSAGLWSYLISPRMKDWLRENLRGFDIVHMHGYRTYQNVITYRMCREHHVPYVIQPDASTPRIMSKRFLKFVFDMSHGRSILRNADRVIAISGEEVQMVLRRGSRPENTEKIYTGMNETSFRELPDYGDYRKKLGLRENDRLVLYLGRLHESKGLDFLLEGFYEATRNQSNMYLVVAGPDFGFEKRIRTLVNRRGLETRVFIVGMLGDRDKLSAMVDADLFAHTVKYMGGVGIAPLEAILCGTTVVVTKECGEIIKAARCGYIVKYGDVAGLASTIEKAFNSEEENQIMVSRGRQYITEHLFWDRVTIQVENVYLRCLEHNSS